MPLVPVCCSIFFPFLYSLFLMRLFRNPSIRPNASQVLFECRDEFAFLPIVSLCSMHSCLLVCVHEQRFTKLEKAVENVTAMMRFVLIFFPISRLCSLDVFSWLLLCRKMEKELVRAQEGERKGAEAILALRDIVSMLEAEERNARVQKKE